MSALTILIIRHAEKPGKKPDEGLPLEGNDLDGTANVIPGWQRAGAWAVLFGSGAFEATYPKPDVVYAASPDKPASDDGKKSMRSHETVIPTCQRLHIEPNISFGVGEEADLVKEVMQLTGTVPIDWEHNHILPGIVAGLRGEQVIPHLPKKWKGKRFDPVLRFDRAGPGVASITATR